MPPSARSDNIKVHLFIHKSWHQLPRQAAVTRYSLLADSGHGVSLYAGVAESFLRVFKTQQAGISDRAVTHAGNRWLPTVAARVNVMWDLWWTKR
jgi:hypothetical protein